MEVPEKINHYIDNLAKCLLKDELVLRCLVSDLLAVIFPSRKITLISLEMLNNEISNFDNAKKSVYDLLVKAKTSIGIFKIDVEIQTYYQRCLFIRMHNYTRALGAYDYLRRNGKLSKLPVNIQLWIFDKTSQIRFKGRKYIVLDLSDVETHKRYPFGDKYVFVNGDYYSKLDSNFKPQSNFDAIMRFFALTNTLEMVKFVEENDSDCLYNLLETQEKFFSRDKDVKAYMDREYELEEIAKDKAKIKAQAEALQAETEARKKAEADKAKVEADKAKVEAENEALKAEIERLKAEKA